MTGDLHKHSVYEVIPDKGLFSVISPSPYTQKTGSCKGFPLSTLVILVVKGKIV